MICPSVQPSSYTKKLESDGRNPPWWVVDGVNGEDGCCVGVVVAPVDLRGSEPDQCRPLRSGCTHPKSGKINEVKLAPI